MTNKIFNDKISLNDAFEDFVFSDKLDPDRGETKNFHSRVWRPSLPVIHLAATYGIFLWAAQGRTFNDVLNVLLEGDHLKDFIRFSCTMEAAFAETVKLRIDPKTLIRFRAT